MSDTNPDPAPVSVSPLFAGLTCRCPRCGEGPLLRRVLELRESCSKCGLSYDFADAGDGPAVFAIMLIGAITCGLALWTEVKYEPEMWVHGMLWGPLTLVLAWLLLPRMKAILVALQYRNKAAVGQLAKK